MKRPPMFMDPQTSTVKMVMLLKAIYRFNAIYIKIPMTFLLKLGKAILKFIYDKRLQITKIILRKNRELLEVLQY
jgi:hypothetical protein